MRNIIGSAMVATMALSLFCAIVLFGAVGLDFAAPSLLLGFLVCIFWAIKLITARKVSWKKAPTHWPVLAFLAYAFARYLTSPLEYDSRIELIHVCFYALIYFAAANNFYHSRNRTLLFIVVGTLAVFESSYGIWQAVTKSDSVFLLSRPEYYNGRGSGTYICPNHLAGFLEMSLGLLLGRAFFYHGKGGITDRHAVQKVFILYAALMAVGGILVSFSRIGWMATAAAFLALLLWGETRMRATWQRVTVAALALTIVLGAAWFLPKAWENINRSFLPGQTAGGRTLMWSGTMGVIQENPVFGSGPGTWQWMHQVHRHPDLQIHPVYAHSDVLHLFSDYGLVGWLIVLAFFGCYFWHVALLTTKKTKSDQRSMAIGGSIAVIAILAHSWGDFNLHIPANALFLTLIVGFTAAIDDPKERFERVTLENPYKIGIGVIIATLSIAAGWEVGKGAMSSWQIGKGNDAREILNWNGAIEHYAKAASYDPRNPDPFARIGDTYRSKAIWRLTPGREEERQELAQKSVDFLKVALELNPYQTEAWTKLSNVYDQVFDDREKAHDALMQALKHDPNSAFVYLRLGLHYQRHDEPDKAEEAFRRSEELSRTGDNISRAFLEDPRPGSAE